MAPTKKPTTRDASSSDNGYAYPLSSGSGFDGGVADHMARAFGNWQSDNAVDIMCAVKTEVLAVDDGVIPDVTVDSSYSPGSNPNGSSAYLQCSGGRQFWYTHMISLNVQAGDRVSKGDVIGLSGTANGVDHLHFAAEPPLNPEDVVSGGSKSGGTTTGSGGLGGFSEEDLFAIGRASAISTQLQLPGLANLGESIFMKGAKSIYNDESLLPFVEQVCKASLRQFQSLPNGAFFAFYPDQFGLYGHRSPYWNISDLEIIDGSLSLQDEGMATHVFVVGDTNYSGSIDISELQASKGVITIYDAFTSDFMLQRNSEQKVPDKEDGKNRERQNIEGYQSASSFLQKYGLRPHFEEAPFIRNSFFEIFYAYTQFQTLWANQFRSSFQMTFMPELYPGGIVAFEDYGIQCFIDSVTHTFDYGSGFNTQANFSAVAALSDSNSSISQGMAKPFIKEKK